MIPDPAGSSASVISLREYREAKIDGERELNRNFRAASAAEFGVFKESLQKETREARENVIAKLEVLNELRKAVETDRSLFVRGDKFDAEMRARDSRIEALGSNSSTKVEGVERLLGSRLDGLEKWQAQIQSADLKTAVGGHDTRIQALEDWRNKLLGIGITVGLVSGLVGAFLMRLISGLFGK
jgi:hypothetical protein